MILFAHQITGSRGKKPIITRMCICKETSGTEVEQLTIQARVLSIQSISTQETQGTGKRSQVLLPAAKRLLEMIVIDSAVIAH